MTDEVERMREEIETLKGDALALELILITALSVACEGRGPGYRDAVADAIAELPDLIRARYGLDTKSFLHHGIQRTTENIAAQLRPKGVN